MLKEGFFCRRLSLEISSIVGRRTTRRQKET